MLIHVDYGNGLPVYDQIVRQVKFAVAGGLLRDGELVPSVRELARELAINPNTVARAYRKLQDDRVLKPVRGTGLAVTRESRRRCQTERTRLVGERLEQVLTEAVQSGLPEKEVLALVRRQLNALSRRSDREKKR